MPDATRRTSDNPRLPAASLDRPDPTIPLQCDPTSELMPDLERDLEVLSWLVCSPQLGREVTSYLCDALAGWALAGRGYPQMALPDAGRDCDHLQVLKVILDRIPQRIIDADGVALKLDLGRFGRVLSRAFWASWDPQAVRDSAERELIAAMPQVDAQPATYPLSDGDVS